MAKPKKEEAAQTPQLRWLRVHVADANGRIGLECNPFHVLILQQKIGSEWQYVPIEVEG